MSQKSQEAESSVSSSLSLPNAEDPGSLSQQPQATSSRGEEPLSCLDLSEVASGYLPFFRTCEWLLAEEEELTLRPEVGRDQGAACSPGEAPLPEDLAPPSGFFPYYRSKEERLPGLAPAGWWRGGPRDLLLGREAKEGYFCRATVSDGCPAASAGPALMSGNSPSPACCPLPLGSAGLSCEDSPDAPPSRGHTVCPLGVGLMPYYRSPEEGLRTSPGPPASGPGSQGPLGEMARPRAASL